ncbi:Avirulence protein (Avh) [Phytophthora palmivora]|uniref:RxLR effector protein n=1 Tax=Phytophthora palmivora TaxID=4796 RepID=A0A2P4YVF9_9STRA|nr:Avirulence protein (Avh) [Phytophthora palmivora]
MRLRNVALVAASTLLVIIDGSSVVAKSLTQPKISTVATRQRFLRTYNMAVLENDNEERALNLNSILGVDKLKTAWTQNKLSTYLKKKKTADEVFVKLKLGNKASDKLFQDPKFLAWVKYVDDYNSKPGNKEMSMIPTLTNHYGDDVLAKMLDAASKTDGTKRLASSLQEQQVKFWRSQDMPLADVFTRLKLDRGLDDILTNPSFFAFNRYLVDYNVRYSKSMTMIEALGGSYGDAAVAKMLQTTMTKAKDVETKQLATRLQNQQLQHWKDIGLNSDDIFKDLSLNKAGVTFENPNFIVWGKFLQNYSGERTRPIDKLWANFGEEKLATMLVAPREAIGGNAMVTFLQNKLLEKWLTMERSPKDVSAMLGSSFGGKTFAASYKWNYEKRFGML